MVLSKGAQLINTYTNLSLAEFPWMQLFYEPTLNTLD